MKNFRFPALNSQPNQSQPNQRNPLFALSCLFLTMVAGVGQAVAQDVGFDACAPASCSQAANAAAPSPMLTNLGNVYPFRIYALAQYGTAGTPLRNRRTGAIRLSGVVPPVQEAYIYWAVITLGPPPAAVGRIQVQRLAPPAPTSANVTLNGVVVGVGVEPCPWAGNRITVYRALIPAAVATGNGTYKITVLAGAVGLAGGENPWAAAQVLPLWEGASIVMVGTGTQRVSIYDAGLAGNTFNADGGLAYQLAATVNAGDQLLFDEIGADGQHGQGRIADPAVSAETTVVEGLPIAGPGSDYNDSDWNGGAGLPLPELWDDSGHHFAAPVSTNFLRVGITNGAFGFGDCLTPVVNVLQQP
ncbi:MAG: hypothetical protein LAO56_21715 [Acidobacteriia bacterium]|nr:hypothetical protein [Terriglobia bacterium]